MHFTFLLLSTWSAFCSFVVCLFLLCLLVNKLLKTHTYFVQIYNKRWLIVILRLSFILLSLFYLSFFLSLFFFVKIYFEIIWWLWHGENLMGQSTNIMDPILQRPKNVLLASLHNNIKHPNLSIFNEIWFLFNVGPVKF